MMLIKARKSSLHTIYIQIVQTGNIKLMKGKTLRRHSLHEKTTASVLLKLYISSNE